MKKIPKIAISQKSTYVKIAEDVDFFELFRSIDRHFDTCFIFESLGEEGKFSRYSIIGFDPPHTIEGKASEIVVDDTPYEVENPYEALREMMPPPTIGGNYSGGLVGYLGYEAVQYFEPSLHIKEHEQFDRFIFGVYTDGLVLDKLTNELFYFYYEKDRSELLKKVIATPAPAAVFKTTFVGDTLSKDEHRKVVESVRAQISAGNTFQCEVGFKSKYRVEGDAVGIYGKLRSVNPSPFMYYLKFGEKKVIGASPELLFSLRDGEMVVRPLAGTIRRGKDDAEDQQLARSLVNDPKERAEHTMLVDLHRNDIGKVARFGTVRVKDLMNVKKFSHVQHISSEIIGLIRPGEDMFSALAANFPAGTVTGAPKIESIKIIDANEPEARGPYAGGVGEFGFNGDCTFALTLRSIFISGSDAYAQTSGGIVYDSDPDKEYTEIQNKLAAMKKVLDV